MTRWGTSHFVSRNAAIAYYVDQCCDRATTLKRIREGEIRIGPPALKPGERLVKVDGGLRFAIEAPDAVEVPEP